MNGPVYDYNLGRFLSIDTFIQEPGNSQSMNPYSYLINNPLAGTDPSGYKSVCRTSTNCKTYQVNHGDGKTITGTLARANGKEVTVSVKIRDTAEISDIGSIFADDVKSMTFNTGKGVVHVYQNTGGTEFVVATNIPNIPVMPCESMCHGGAPPEPDFDGPLDVA